MLPPYIIEQIRKREQEEAHEAPVIQLPLPEPRPRREQKPVAPESQRGVIVIDLV